MTREKIEMATLVSIFLLALFAVTDIKADEMVHQFKNPSFSGIGTSAHWLTIENQEFSMVSQCAEVPIPLKLG